MTSTSVFVFDNYSPQQLFAYCQQLLKTPGGTVAERHEANDLILLTNPSNLNLKADLSLFYYEDKMMSHEHLSDYWLRVDFDSVYSHVINNSIGSYHAQLVSLLGEYLEQNQLAWAWQNELTGVFVEDKFTNLLQLIDISDKASQWYQKTVMPLLRDN